jgi:hypothetical protein
LIPRHHANEKRNSVEVVHAVADHESSAIEALIGRADTVVFVLSPDAVRPGTVALKEVEFAASLNKRFPLSPASGL